MDIRTIDTSAPRARQLREPQSGWYPTRGYQQRQPSLKRAVADQTDLKNEEPGKSGRRKEELTTWGRDRSVCLTEDSHINVSAQPRRAGFFAPSAAARWAASVNSRCSVGSVGGFECSHSFCSPTDIEAIVAPIVALAVRIMSTASKAFVVDLSITEHLPRRTNLNSGIPEPKVHGMVAMNPRQVDDMPKVPAHEHIHAGDRGHRNVFGVGQHSWP